MGYMIREIIEDHPFFKFCIERSVFTDKEICQFGVKFIIDKTIIQIYTHQYSGRFSSSSVGKLNIDINNKNITVMEFLELFKLKRPELVRLMLFNMDEFEK